MLRDVVKKLIRIMYCTEAQRAETYLAGLKRALTLGVVAFYMGILAIVIFFSKYCNLDGKLFYLSRYYAPMNHNNSITMYGKALCLE